MWFAKWFGGRKKEHEDDEPARFPPQPALTGQKTASPSAPRPASVLDARQKKKGFDPYNSGAFERRNAWERTNLR
ncbi:MAG: hypothetical protein GX535_09105 [Xanthomonadaceae bacterium]|nr:hypothetical protein [Xanthomonadaceae bacterium]